MVFVKSMTCQGFKSFKYRTKIRFDRGFTAIVGANGSGKSNVIDAFIFVLGELSSKTMRAKNMADLICNGAKNDKEPSKFAFVEIEFDNADRQIPVNADIVTVSRKIDRDGKGEYRLNGKKTTRTEIQELLDLANMKPTSSNLILQGELFRLISMSPLERREMIDDLAGIATYDEKKKAAQEELEVIEQNLAQVTLILNEVSVQMDQLEKERDDALKFLRISDEKKSAENAQLLKKVQELEDVINRQQNEQDNLTKELQGIEAQRDALQATLVELDANLGTIQAEIAAKQSAELGELGNQISTRKDRVAELTTTRKHVKKERDTTEKRRTGLEEEYQRIQGERESLQEEIAESEGEKQAIEQDLHAKTLEHNAMVEELQAKDAEYVSIKDQIESVKDEINKLKAEKSDLVSDLKVLQNNKNQADRDQTQKEKELAGTIKKLVSAQVQLASFQESQDDPSGDSEGQSADGIERRIKDLNARLKDVQNAITKKREALVTLKSKLKFLKKADSGNRAVNEILALRDSGQVKGICGTIAELGTCNQEYTTALEVAGGGGFSFIVVDRQVIASQCIEYLKSNRLGRATFIPLDKIIPKPFNDRLPASEKVIGRAVDLIDFDPTYLKAFEFVFGRSVIVDDLPTATQLQIPARRVTIDGDVVEGSNLMTGGTIRKGSGMTFSPKEVQMVPQLEEELARLESTEISLQEEIRTAQGEISTSLKAKITREREASKIYAQISRLEEDIQTYQALIPELEAAIATVEDNAQGIAADIESLQEKIAAVNEAIESQQGRRAIFEEQLQNSGQLEMRKQVQALEKQVASLEKKLQEWEITLAKKRTRLEDSLVSRAGELTTEINDVTTQVHNLDAELDAIAEEKDTLTEELTSLEASYSEKSREISQIIDQKNQLLDEITRLKLNIDSLTSSVHPIQLKQNTIQLKVEELQRDRDVLKVRVNPDTPFDPKLLEMTVADLGELINRLQAEKTVLEPVNMKAIDAYDAAHARFQDLTEKHEKVVQERLSILQFMEEIEAEKKKVFMETFTAINRNFGFIFAKLSPNGEAALELENEDDPFAGGINMLARPGGKKWCLTQAMSGGEKTLTVIALVLGIQLYVPSPYYVLDEIDAALDDENAKMVAELISELSNRSQFILITHRDVTMARSDQLLGVTNDDGVTQVVNLNLEEVLKTIASS
ncbi:MAG TPA: chromosome segregation protein SMC [Candidatus Lokiarchaeia archaeon]|nr:chromosome segregation protein SMC [Candidatus Lokiarchaeia archaeon]